jgi:DNA-binding XRE family transcriptional regulator
MLVAVKKHPIDFVIHGNVPEKYLLLLRHDYGSDVVVKETDEYELATDSAWYKEMQAKETPGANLRFYRKLHKTTQAVLASKLGVTKQKVSNMENGIIPISRKTAILLSKTFEVPAGRFI